MADVTKKVLEIEIDVDSGDVKVLNKQVEETAKNTDKAKKGTEGLAGSFRKVGTAMKAAGIGLIVALLAKLADALGNNQKAADFFSTAMNALSIAFNDFFNFISDNIDTVVQYFRDLFDNPGEKLREIATTIRDYVVKNVQLLISGFGKLGEAMAFLFDGEFQKAWEIGKEGALEMGEAILKLNPATAVLTNVAEAVYENRDAITEYTKSLWENGEAIVDNQKQLGRLEVESRRLQLLNQQQAELQRQIRDDETRTFEERIAANEKLGEILEESVRIEQDLVNKRIAILENEQRQLGYSEERYLEIMNLRVELIDIEERITGVQSEQLTNRNALLREQADYEKEILEEKEKQRKEAHEKELARIKKEQEDEAAAQQARFRVASSTIGALSALNDSLSSEDSKNARAAFERQKALGIASATVSTAEAAINAYKSTVAIPIVGPGLAVLAAAAATAAGLAQINAIRKQTFEGDAGSSPSPNIPTISVGEGSIGAPQFNTVGASGVNQLDESINNQNNSPVKAYVVSGEVTSAQSLDRNTIEQASFP